MRMVMARKRINLSIILTSILIIILSVLLISGCRNIKNCPPGYGGTYWYVDVSRLPFELNETNQFAYAGMNGIDYENNVTQILRQYSIGEAGWFVHCETTKHYSLFMTPNITEKKVVSKDEFKEFVAEYNTSCNGCIKEIIIAAFH